MEENKKSKTKEYLGILNMRTLNNTLLNSNGPNNKLQEKLENTSIKWK